MVPGAGIEPARPCDREILSLLCLPISPPGLSRLFYHYLQKKRMEARAGIEPASTALQAAA
jgi:hypothetical protein